MTENTIPATVMVAPAMVANSGPAVPGLKRTSSGRPSLSTVASTVSMTRHRTTDASTNSDGRKKRLLRKASATVRRRSTTVAP